MNLMSPAYWVYLVMAVTILFNLMKGYSRFRLWRIDAAREGNDVIITDRGTPVARIVALDSTRLP